MTSNLMDIYGSVGSAAKLNAEAVAARSVRLAGVVQDGYRRWVDTVTANMGDTARMVEGLGKVRSTADLIELQRDWLGATSARVAGDLKAFIDLSSKFVAEAALPVQTAEAESAPVATVPVAAEEPDAPQAELAAAGADVTETVAPEAMAAEPVEAASEAAAPSGSAPAEEVAVEEVAVEAAAPAEVPAETTAEAAPVAGTEPVVAAPAPKPTRRGRSAAASATAES